MSVKRLFSVLSMKFDLLSFTERYLLSRKIDVLRMIPTESKITVHYPRQAGEAVALSIFNVRAEVQDFINIGYLERLNCSNNMRVSRVDLSKQQRDELCRRAENKRLEELVPPLEECVRLRDLQGFLETSLVWFQHSSGDWKVNASSKFNREGLIEFFDAGRLVPAPIQKVEVF